MDAAGSGRAIARSRVTAARRIVVKIGSNVLTGGSDRLDLAVMASLVGQVAGLRRSGREVLVVTSGAVAAGRHALARHSAPSKSVPLRQMLASIGQSRLMAAYDQLFGWHDLVVAQALLTRSDLADRLGFLNARMTLIGLLEQGVIPVVNENDVVAVDEIKDLTFGDNDALSAQVANMVEADLLVILTDTGGLFTSDPSLDPKAQLVPYVPFVDETIERMAGGSLSGRGLGGMTTKVRAAKLAASAGAMVLVASGKQPDSLLRALAGEEIGTLFAASDSPLESRKRWLLSGLGSRGAVVIDAGAAEALSGKGKSLLAAGVVAVEGSFERGDLVDIAGQDGNRVAFGICNYSSADITAIKGLRSDQTGDVLGYDYGAEIVHRNNLALVDRTGSRSVSG